MATDRCPDCETDIREDGTCRCDPCPECGSRFDENDNCHCENYVGLLAMTTPIAWP
jgi:hypothetical protein